MDVWVRRGSGRAMICAYATQADQVFVYVRGEFPLAIERLQAIPRAA
jgi:NADH:ubiquinone oxidoreductase subunit F (NADH-binding)